MKSVIPWVPLIDQLLEQAVAESNELKFSRLLRVINRLLRAYNPNVFDIFSGVPEGRVAWLETVEGIHEARFRLHELFAQKAGDYFVLNIGDHSILEQITSGLTSGPFSTGIASKLRKRKAS